MMAHFMGNHISARELTGSTKLTAHGVEEVHVQIDLVVTRAVKRPHGRLSRAAGRARHAGEQHQLGVLILSTAFTEDLGPDILG